MATMPVKMPNANQYGTPRIHRPTAVSKASTAMEISWPTTQARSVAPASAEMRAAMRRWRGANSEISPLLYNAGWRARYKAITSTLAPSMNSMPPPRTYPRIEPLKNPTASLTRPDITPDDGFARSV